MIVLSKLPLCRHQVCGVETFCEPIGTEPPTWQKGQKTPPNKWPRRDGPLIFSVGGRGSLACRATFPWRQTRPLLGAYIERLPKMSSAFRGGWKRLQTQKFTSEAQQPPCEVARLGQLSRRVHRVAASLRIRPVVQSCFHELGQPVRDRMFGSAGRFLKAVNPALRTVPKRLPPFSATTLR